MTVQQTIERKLRAALRPSVAEVLNESHRHGGPATESHFNITVVSEEFQQMALLRRHQTVYKLLQQELGSGVHALALHLYAPLEWTDRQQTTPSSPDCRGASK